MLKNNFLFRIMDTESYNFYLYYLLSYFVGQNTHI